MKKNNRYIVLFIVALLLVGGLIILLKKGDKTIANLDKDKQIGYLLLKEELDTKVDTDRINVNYDDKTHVFEVEYIINDNEGIYDDEMVISTSDFVDYSVSTTYFKDKIPNTVSTNGPGFINYEVKNKVIKLAKSLKYSVGDVLTTNQYKKVLGVLNKTKIGDYIKLFEKNGYKLENYYSLKNNNIGFLYRLDDNNFLEIKSYDNNSKGWSVYGISETKLRDDFSLSEKEYDEQKLYSALQKKNFDYSNAFASLFE